MRPIANAGGWEINNDAIYEQQDSLPKMTSWIKTVLPSKEEGPILFHAASLTAMRDNGCEVLLTSLNGAYIVGGLGSYGKGQIAVLTDSEFPWNGNPDHKWEGLYPLHFCDPKNRAFIKNLIFRLLPPKTQPRLDDFPFSNKLLSPERVFVYGNGGDFQNYSNFLTALTNANIPVFGVNFKDNEHNNILYIPVSFRKRRLYLHNACAIELLTGNKNEEICFENSKDTFACGAGFGLNDTLKSMAPNDLKNPDFLIATDNVPAIGDTDIITNAFLSEAERTGILDKIIEFLKS